MRLFIPTFFYIPKHQRVKVILSTLSLLLLLATIPAGLYLISKPQDPRSRASSEGVAPVQQLQSGFFLESKKEQWNGLEEIAVSVIAKSETEAANLFSAQLLFDPKVLEVVKIASSSGTPNSIEGDYFVKKWVEANFDNSTGLVSIVGGVSSPGLKTAPDSKSILATVTFRAKQTGETNLNFSDLSAIFRNSDNLSLFSTKQGLPLVISGQIASPSPTTRSSAQKLATSQLTITSPKGGETFPYLGVIPLRWNARSVDEVAIYLYKDSVFFGRILDFVPNPNLYDWEPKNSLALAFINDSSFQIELKGRTRNGDNVTSLSGPFIVSFEGKQASSAAQIQKSEADLNFDSRIDLKDISFLLSNYGKNGNSDLNRDGLINDLDLWLLRKILLEERVIH